MKIQNQRSVWDLSGGGALLFPFQLCPLRWLRGVDRVSSPLSNHQLLFLPLTQLSCLCWLHVDGVAGKASSVEKETVLHIAFEEGDSGSGSGSSSAVVGRGWVSFP